MRRHLFQEKFSSLFWKGEKTEGSYCAFRVTMLGLSCLSIIGGSEIAGCATNYRFTGRNLGPR